MRRSVTFEWESDDSPIGSQYFFKIVGIVADLVNVFPKDIYVTYDGKTGRYVNGHLQNVPVDKAAEDEERLARARVHAGSMTLIDLLAVGLKLGILTSDEVKVLSQKDLVPLLFDRADAAGCTERLARAVCAAAEEPRSV